MKPLALFLTKLVTLVVLLFVCCEYLVYFSTELHCDWPELDKEKSTSRSADPLKAFFLADTHLLGSRLGHWFDKLRREWQMRRAFQTSITLFHPEAVFVLGDLMDEGKWANDKEFYSTVDRFIHMFRTPPSTQFHVVVGNHDVGFHDYIRRSHLDRFKKYFEAPSVKIIEIKDVIFVAVNSMAFHGDGCSMCLEGRRQLKSISEQLNCSRFGSPKGQKADAQKNEKKCLEYEKLPKTAPILLQHFPLYRLSDSMCKGSDAPPTNEKTKPHRVKMDVISEESSKLLLHQVQPRFILSGHTHHGCYVTHHMPTSQSDVSEISVPSFSWRNRNNPSFIMAVITPEEFVWRKCFLPEESTVIRTYIIGSILTFLWIVKNVSFFIRAAKSKSM